ncbi:MAG TPA: phage/plasmid primase, P4 family, partial [Casimicrobiaceae bacterium]
GGANGKSTSLGIMADTLGDYAGTAAPGLLAATKGDRHPTEIASLMGKRQVTAHESGEGVVLREDFIKQATGDDVLTARFMRGDFFDFPPTHKLQLLTNHKPQVKGQDRGIWRRVQLVPYLASFGTPEQVAAGTHTHVRDVELIDRLRDELEGVLAWRVRGAVAWTQEGLRPPEAVRVASAEYKSEQDRVGQFVAECCERGPREGPDAFMEPLTDAMGGLYPAYVSWAKDGGIHPLSKARFTDDVLRVVGADRTVERKTSAENGKRRKLSCVPGLRLLPE